MRLRACLLAACCGIALALPIGAANRAQDPDKLAAIAVQELHYGDVLFHFYAGDEFEALTRLEAYDRWQRMPRHSTDAALLAGGLYLSLGLHSAAGRRFETLLTPGVPMAVRNRAWFYLAKVWYARGYYERAEQALGRINASLSPQLDAERMHLLVNVLMQQERFDEAATRVANWKGSAEWMAYARFNLGVALVRQDRLADADPILSAVGRLNSRNAELLNLRDRANLALGFAWMQKNEPARAGAALERVRLSGPHASRALLGAGWAASAQGDHRGALTPWLALRERNLLDAAVQESYLAVPYAFEQLGARAQAAEYYESAIDSFQSETQRLDQAIERLGDGRLLDDLLGEEKLGRMGWFWQLRALPEAPQSRYLYALLAGNDFQEGLKNYRDLTFLGATIERWEQNIGAYGAMIDTRELAYAERLPRADALLAINQPALLIGERTQVNEALTAAETGGDVAALGDAKQREQWDKIRALEQGLPAAGSEDERDKLRLLKGVLYWQLDNDFKARVYQQKRAVRELDAALNEAQNRWVRVQAARGSVPTNTREFAERIATLRDRMGVLGGALVQAAGAQERLLVRLAQQELGAQQSRLAAYEVQARFSLADIYDRAATGSAPSGSAGSAPAGAASGSSEASP